MRTLHHCGFLTAILTVGIAFAPSSSNADCVGASTSTVKRSFAKAQELERGGNSEAALHAYVAAQEYTCDGPNPVELQAAQRAAALALPLAQAAEAAKDFERAYQLYDKGGHYAAADRAMLELIRSRPDDPELYTRAREFFDYRALPAFQANNKVTLRATGAYTPNPQHLAEVQTMPSNGAERALKAEAAAFNEQYLREYVEFVQSRPEELADQAAAQRYAVAANAFHKRWANDPLKASRDALALAHRWSIVTNDDAVSQRIFAKARERAEQRVVTITRSFSRAPELLDAAIEYQSMLQPDDATREARVAAIRQQAAKLGDEAAAQQRLGLAADYYRVARLDDKAQQMREQQQQLAMSRVQPSIDAARRQVEELQKAFSDPQKIKELQEQARQMQKALEAQQRANTNSADDLERELGI
jgi:hypothetical protein